MALNPARTLVVCNYIHPFYATMPFLKRLLGMPAVVFYGDQLWPGAPGVIPYDQSDGQAGRFRAAGGGFFAYRCMLDAVRQFPDYDGYLFMMDDVLLFPSRLARLDPDRIAFSRQLGGCELVADDPRSRQWHWWDHPWGRAPCREAWPRLNPSWLERLARVSGSPSVLLGGANDCFYLPRIQVEAFVEVFSVFSEARVFLEIAVPTGLTMLDPQAQEIGIRYLWSGQRRWWPLHLPYRRGTGLHPVKFSSRWNQALARLLSPR